MMNKFRLIALIVAGLAFGIALGSADKSTSSSDPYKQAREEGSRRYERNQWLEEMRYANDNARRAQDDFRDAMRMINQR
jgi:hypothetical protein